MYFLFCLLRSGNSTMLPARFAYSARFAADKAESVGYQNILIKDVVLYLTGHYVIWAIYSRWPLTELHLISHTSLPPLTWAQRTAAGTPWASPDPRRSWPTPWTPPWTPAIPTEERNGCTRGTPRGSGRPNNVSANYSAETVSAFWASYGISAEITCFGRKTTVSAERLLFRQKQLFWQRHFISAETAYFGRNILFRQN